MGKCRPQSQNRPAINEGRGNTGGGRTGEAAYIGEKGSGNTRDNDATNADAETLRGNGGMPRVTRIWQTSICSYKRGATRMRYQRKTLCGRHFLDACCAPLALASYPNVIFPLREHLFELTACYGVYIFASNPPQFLVICHKRQLLIRRRLQISGVVVGEPFFCGHP